MSIRIAFTGGGTAGHVFPALSVYQQLQERGTGCSFLWIGSRKGIEYSIINETDIPFYSLPAGKLRRYFSLRNFLDLFKIAAGFIKAFAILMRHRPDVLFSKGGYVTVPPVWAASLLGIPVVSHESDLHPGLATRLNLRFSDTVCVAYEKTRDLLSGKKTPAIIVTGNPVRREIRSVEPDKALKKLGLSASEMMQPVVMVIGGSLGARVLNTLVTENLGWLQERCTVIHQVGGANAAEYIQSKRYYPGGFFKENHLDLMAAADLIISRAGASTIWEAAFLGKPMILVPLSTGASRGDQIKNAAYFEKAGAAVVLQETELGQFKEVCCGILEDSAALKRMSEAAGALVPGDAAEKIADILLRAVTDKEHGNDRTEP